MQILDPPEAQPPPERICVRYSRDGQEFCKPIPLEQISEVIPDTANLIWVDIQDPTTEDLERLGQEFGFHRLALEDAANQRQRPKVDEYPDYYFVVMYAVSQASAERVLTEEVDIFIGRNYVVTLHRGVIPGLVEARERWDRTDPELRHQVGFLVHTITDSLIDSFFPVVDEIEDRLDELELSMFRGGRGVDPEKLLSIKRNLFTLRRAIYPLRDVFNAFLRRDHHFFAEETFPYFQDVYDHILRLLDVIDIQRDMASGALDAHLSVISNRLNEIMKSLTVVTICVAIMGAIFGAWGMNFDRIPLAHHRDGFWLVTSGALILVWITIALAKWRRWW
jgi:magnesium transporter